MAPIPVVEDYYAVLEVEQTCAPELISKAYKRLAKELHPDRNSRPDATQALHARHAKIRWSGSKWKRSSAVSFLVVMSALWRYWLHES
jgi:hypothetical protein